MDIARLAPAETRGLASDSRLGVTGGTGGGFDYRWLRRGRLALIWERRRYAHSRRCRLGARRCFGWWANRYPNRKRVSRDRKAPSRFGCATCVDATLEDPFLFEPRFA